MSRMSICFTHKIHHKFLSGEGCAAPSRAPLSSCMHSFRSPYLKESFRWSLMGTSCKGTSSSAAFKAFLQAQTPVSLQFMLTDTHW